MAKIQIKRKELEFDFFLNASQALLLISDIHDTEASCSFHKKLTSITSTMEFPTPPGALISYMFKQLS